MFSCGRAKTIRIRQRILRKYREVRKNTHYCVGHGKALDFLSISLRDAVPIMHTREERLFFFSSPYCFCEGKLFSEVNLWHLTALSSLWLLAHKAFKESSTFLGWLLWISLRPVIPILLSFFLFFFSTVRLQVVFGLPLLLFPSGAQVIAVLQSLFWSVISICPILSHLLIYAVSPFYSESNQSGQSGLNWP